MVAGALMGTHRQWVDLSKDWRKRLKRDGLKYFRSTEYNSLTGEFYRYRDAVKYPKPMGGDAATALRNDLDELIKKYQIVGVASVIPLAMFREVIMEEGLMSTFNPNPFSAAMQTVMRECALIAREHLSVDAGNRVAFVCDDGPSSALLSAAYAEFKNKNVAIRDMLGGNLVFNL